MPAIDGSANVVYLKTHTPFYVVWRTLLVTVVMFVLFIIWPIYEGRPIPFNERALVPLSILLTLIYGLHIIQSFMHKGYRISYDADTIYFREYGVANWKLERKKERAVRFDEIETIICEGTRGEGMAFDISLGDVISIYSRNDDDAEPIMLGVLAFSPADVRAFTWHLYAKRPDAFDQNVIDYLNEDLT